MAKIFLPPGCMGVGDGDDKRMANKPGGHLTLDDSDPRDAKILRKLQNQDYAQAGLVDAGPEKFAVRNTQAEGRWCRTCGRLWHAWAKICSKCGQETVLESEMDRTLPEGQYAPFGPVAN
jgi:hypothetical protein